MLGMYQFLVVVVYVSIRKKKIREHCSGVWERENPSQPEVAIHLAYAQQNN